MSQHLPSAQIKLDDTISLGTIELTPKNADTGYALKVDSKISNFSKNVFFNVQFYPEK